jgi:rod shape-determining protein MreC
MAAILPPAERRSRALLGLYAFASVVLLLTGDRIPQSALRGVGAFLFAPLDRLVLVADRMTAAWRENEALHRRVTELELEVSRLRDAGAENQRLRDSLALPPYRGVTLRTVEVLALTGEPIPSAATLSAGARQGVHVGDGVVTSEGLVGRVGEVYGGLSRVVLLTDPLAAVACEVESTGVQGILRFTGTPYPRLVLTEVPVADTVRLHERVITSGMSLRYPRGIPVGMVKRVSVDPSGLTQDIEVAPAARLSRIRHAFIVPGPALPVGVR